MTSVSREPILLRLLGPVEVNLTSRWFAPGPPKQRAVLAALALKAGRCVSMRSLIETLWGEDPPPSAVKNIQLYVWKLRHLLGDVVLHRPAGYSMPAHSVMLDIDQFRSETAMAREACREGDMITASRGYRRALQEWRGPAMADLVTAGMAVHLAQPLAAERCQVIYELVELELAEGSGAKLVPQLAMWVAEEPHDERLREWQVRALLDAGQPARALAAYRAAESALANDLGVGTSAALRILAESAHEAMGQVVGPARNTAAPHQLPAAVTMFVGRRDETHAIVELLWPRVRSVPIVTIVGPGGIGKSALGLRVAHRAASRFPDGQLYLDLQGATPGLDPVSVDDALSTLLRSLGVAAEEVPRRLADAVRLFRSRTAGRCLLIVLDNAANPDQVRHLIPGTGGSAVLITARPTMTELDCAAQVLLDTLPAADAIELLTSALGRTRVFVEPEAQLNRLVHICGGLPLALRLAAARLVSRPTWPLAAFNEMLANEHDRLNELRQANVALRSSFAVSYQNLSPQGQCVFRCCGLFPGSDFSVAAIAALAELDEARVSELLEALVDTSLLYTRTAGRYQFHDLIRIYAAECARAQDPETVGDHRLARLAAWYLVSADVADRILMPGRGRVTISHDFTDLPMPPLVGDRSQALAWFETERCNLRELIRASAQRKLHSLAWQLPMVMKGFLELRRYTNDWITTHQIGLVSVQAIGDPYSHARVLNGLGSAYWRGERLSDAIECYTMALTIIRALADRRTEAILLTNLGGIHSERGDYELALGALRLALRIAEEVGDFDESFALNNLGHAYHECGRFHEALVLLQDALRIRREQGNRHGEGVTLHCVADTLLGLERIAEADDAATQSLSICVEQHNRYGHAAALHTLGTIRIAQQRHDEAIAHLHEAIGIYGQAGTTREQASAIADLLRAGGKPVESIDPIEYRH